MTKQIPALYALRAFEVASRHNSFSRAADDLCLTQSAISQHVKTLENHFGCALFERAGPKISLTPTGKILSDDLRVAFKLIEDSCALLKEQRHIIRLKSPSTLAVRWLLKAIDGFNRDKENHAVQLSSVWMDIDVIDFYSEPFDCAIILSDGKLPSNLESFKMFDEWLIPVCHPDYLPDSGIDLSNLRTADLLHSSPDRRDWRRWLAKVGASDTTSLNRGQVFDTIDQGITAALQGLGVSVADLALVSSEVRNGSLKYPFDAAVMTGDGYYMVWLKESPKAKEMHKLMRFLKSQAPALPETDIRYLC